MFADPVPKPHHSAGFAAGSIKRLKLHQVRFLKPFIADEKIVRCHESLAYAGDEAAGLWWRAVVGEEGGPAPQSKRYYSDGKQDPFEDVTNRIADGVRPGVVAIVITPSAVGQIILRSGSRQIYALYVGT